MASELRAHAMNKGDVAAQLYMLQPARTFEYPRCLFIGVPLRYVSAYGRSITSTLVTEHSGFSQSGLTTVWYEIYIG